MNSAVSDPGRSSPRKENQNQQDEQLSFHRQEMRDTTERPDGSPAPPPTPPARAPTTDPAPLPATPPRQPLPCLHTLEAGAVFQAASDRTTVANVVSRLSGRAEAWAPMEPKLSHLGLLRALLRNTYKDLPAHPSGT